ncbi:MAG: response regulator [Acidobacteriota bacterium]
MASIQLIDLTRAELGKLGLLSLGFNLHATVRQAVEVMAVLASCKRITLGVHISSLVPFIVMGDPKRLSQILITLVRTSIDRLDQGEIRVEVGLDINDATGARIKFTVCDDGPPLGQEALAHFFDGGLEKESLTENGLDLDRMLAKRLARMMGGDLWAECEPKTGAVFHLDVNLGAPTTASLGQLCKVGVEVRTDRRPLRLLVADDSADTLVLIRALLKDVPWGIESANNGRQALELAVSREYDLVLMDLDMPEMSGYVATRQIRISECLREVPPVPIVALTAYSEAEAILKSIEAGCTAHVSKPIRKAALMEVIQRYAIDRERDWAFSSST